MQYIVLCQSCITSTANNLALMFTYLLNMFFEVVGLKNTAFDFEVINYLTRRQYNMYDMLQSNFGIH